MNQHKALRATTAAPGYFEEFSSNLVPNERLIDGGLLHNNPWFLFFVFCFLFFFVACFFFY